MTYKILILFLLACNSGSDSQKGDKELDNTDNDFEVILSSDTTKIIAAIRQKVEAINSFKGYDKEVRDMFDYSSEGGQLLILSRDDTVKKLVATYYGSIGKAVEEYYMDEGNLIFVFTSEVIYDRPITQNPVSVTSTEENRYYFLDGKLVKWLDKDGNPVDSNSQEFKNQGVKISNMDFYTETWD